MKKIIYTDQGASFNAIELWKTSIYFTRCGKHWHDFSKKKDRVYIDYLVKIGAAINLEKNCYRYDENKLKGFIAKLSNFLEFDKKDPDEIVHIKYHPYRTEFYTANCNMYYSQEGICLGIFSNSVTKQIPFYNRLHSTVSFLKSDVIELVNACDKSKSITNKMNLCSEYLRLYKKYYGNICLGDYPQGSAKAYRDAINSAEKGGAHWLDGIDGFQVDKEFITTDDIKNNFD